jgi:very-short-patch-repair endonuclease
VTFPTYQPAKPSQLKRARVMRKAMTEPEKLLWLALRQQLPNHSFRRQFLIGPCIVDFCCLSARLVIEVDGNQHGTDEALAFDAKRTALIAMHGFRVLRFSNADVRRSLESVLETLLAWLDGPQTSDVELVEEPPPLAPPRKGEGSAHA